MDKVSLFTRAVVTSVLLVFSWFSTQAPVTPALNAITAHVNPSSVNLPRGVSPVAEDLSNTSLKEHLSVSRRLERLILPPSGAERMFIIDASRSGMPGVSSSTRHRAFSGRDVLIHCCIMRT